MKFFSHKANLSPFILFKIIFSYIVIYLQTTAKLPPPNEPELFNFSSKDNSVPYLSKVLNCLTFFIEHNSVRVYPLPSPISPKS